MGGLCTVRMCDMCVLDLVQGLCIYKQQCEQSNLLPFECHYESWYMDSSHCTTF